MQTNFGTPGVQVTNYHVLANIFRQLRPDQLKGQGRPLVAKLTLLGALFACLQARTAPARCSLWLPMAACLPSSSSVCLKCSTEMDTNAACTQILLGTSRPMMAYWWEQTGARTWLCCKCSRLM